MPNPKGNPQNMKPPRTKAEAKKRGKNGGIKSGQARKAKKNLREHMQALLDSTIKDKSGKELTGAEAMAIRAFQSALKGDWKAWELTRDSSGNKPIDKVVVAEVEQSIIDDVERAVFDK